MRPATSHNPQNRAMETRRHTPMPGTHRRDARSGSSATEAALDCSTRAIDRPLHAELFLGPVKRAELPEILDLQGCGIACDLAGEVEEGEIVLSRFRGAAGRRHALGSRRLLVVAHDVGLELL